MSIFEPTILINTLGYLGIFGIVFLESAFFLIFFLPGDTLLFSAGLLASQGYLDLFFILIGFFLANYLGVIVGYIFGLKVGVKIFERKNSFFFNSENLAKTEKFYARYGSWAIVLSRFVPVVRTLAPTLAGVGKMPMKVLLKYNAIGSLLWVCSVTLVGYFFGSVFPNLGKYVVLIVFSVVFLSLLLPIVSHLWKFFKRKKTSY